jgi:hypothetical protein
MSTRTKFGMWASSVVLAILATTFSADAAGSSCSKFTGTWFVYNVRLNANGTQSVNNCTINVQSSGTWSGTCTGYALGGDPAAVATNNASGTLVLDSVCSLAGSTFDVPAANSHLTVTAGHMNGNVASGITANTDTSGATPIINPVRLLTLIKQ